MARNLEIKAICSDLDAAAARARALGATYVGVLRQRDTYFHCPRGRLKLREIAGAEAELIAYDRPDQPDARYSAFWLVPVSDPIALREALSRTLGIRGVVAKTRTLYRYGRTRIHLDRVEDLGDFVELETAADGRPEAEVAAECAAVRAALGIEEGALLAGSYLDLLLAQQGDSASASTVKAS